MARRMRSLRNNPGPRRHVGAALPALPALPVALASIVLLLVLQCLATGALGSVRYSSAGRADTGRTFAGSASHRADAALHDAGVGCAAWVLPDASGAGAQCGAVAGLQLIPHQGAYPGSFSCLKLRGVRSLFAPFVRDSLPRAAVAASRFRVISTNRPPADLLPPSTQPLLASLPDRAPPAV